LANGLSYLLITHNFGVVSELCQQTAVLYLGRVAEIGPTGILLSRWPATGPRRCWPAPRCQRPGTVSPYG
jgi:ABC-type glutathione transport system ATPase component